MSSSTLGDPPTRMESEVRSAKEYSTSVHLGTWGRRYTQVESLVGLQRSLHPRLLVRAVVACDPMHAEVLRHFEADLHQEAQPLHLGCVTAPCGRSTYPRLRLTHRGEQADCPVCPVMVIVVCLCPDVPDSQQKSPIGTLRKAWHWIFSSQEGTTALSGGLTYRPIASQNLRSKCLSSDSLNVLARCGLSPVRRQMRLTVDCETPACRAVLRVLQWILPRDFCLAWVTTFPTVAGWMTAGPSRADRANR